MPTARELLEQADALMRRNRGGDSGIPVLTDRVSEVRPEASRRGPATRDRSGATLRLQGPDSRTARADKSRDDRMSAAAPPADLRQESARARDAAPESKETSPTPGGGTRQAEPPVLTDAVQEIAVGVAPLPAERAEGEPSLWLGPDTIDPSLHSITGPAPDTVAVVPPVTLRAPTPRSEPSGEAGDSWLPDPSVTRTFRAAGSATTPPPAGSMPPPAASTPPDAAGAARASDDERWRSLAEQISMQVLQRLDLFIDTGLKEQLAAHLEPIVARAGAELVETINEHVGQLVRSYIAEAIEREIAQWRQDQP
jgi:hypothetical protein